MCVYILRINKFPCSVFTDFYGRRRRRIGVRPQQFSDVPSSSREHKYWCSLSLRSTKASDGKH